MCPEPVHSNVCTCCPILFIICHMEVHHFSDLPQCCACNPLNLFFDLLCRKKQRTTTTKNFLDDKPLHENCIKIREHIIICLEYRIPFTPRTNPSLVSSGLWIIVWQQWTNEIWTSTPIYYRHGIIVLGLCAFVRFLKTKTRITPNFHLVLKLWFYLHPMCKRTCDLVTCVLF